MLKTSYDIGTYWHTVLDTIQEGLMIISPTGQILFMNRAAEELTGYKSSELIGRSCTTLECTGCQIYGKGHGENWCELFVVGNVDSKRCLVITKNAKPIHVLKRASVLKDEDGNLIGAVEALTDITEIVNNEKEIERLRKSLHSNEGYAGIIGRSESMRRVFSLLEGAANSDATVIITGESGTGKELAARAIHEQSRRAFKPFVKVDCVTLAESVLESELFGHEKGAFTGADRLRIGRFEDAEGGDVFLDEIGDIPPSVQVKLLRVLEEKVIERVGGNKPIQVNARVITATNRDLEKLVETGAFRQDLFYRINVVPIRMPPLRERREDIPLLAGKFVEKMAESTGRRIEGFTPEAMAIMYSYSWPGNVRELKNTVEYAFVVCRNKLIDLGHLPESLSSIDHCGDANESKLVQLVIHDSADEVAPDSPASGEGGPTRNAKDELISALRQARGNQSEAARLLGVSRMTIYKRMKKYGINISRDIQ